MKRITITVPSCRMCPFARDAATMCTATGERRHIVTIYVPRWCPLRKQDHLVTLRVK